MPPWPIFVHCAVGSELVLRHALHNNVMNETTTKIFPYLERLLDGEEVEWKTLGEVCDRTKGIKITATQMKAMHKSNAPVKIFAGGQTFALVDYNDLPQNDIYFFPSIIVKSRGIIEFEYYDKPFSHKSEMWSYHTNSPDVNAKFLYYYLKTREDYFQQLGSVMQMPQISIPTTEKFSIPIPPLRVQARIVEILDKFTQLEAQLEAELQAELEARRKQYAYYRDQLLNFSQYPPLNVNIEWKTLGEVCVHLRTGLNPRRNFKLNTEDASNYYVTVRELGGTELLYSEKTDLINDDALQLINNRSKLKVNDILFSGTGTIGKTAFISKEPTNWNIKEGVYALTLNTHYVLPMFALRYLQTQSTIDWIDRMAAGGIVRSITMKNLEQLPIPIPPLSEQRRIVDILGRFDTLTNSISEGLPKEIALRRQQYAYYRDALLSFPRPEVSA